MMSVHPNFNRSLVIVLILVCVAAISRLIPPFQSPDENFHLLRADMIAHGQWLLKSEDGTNGREGGLVDTNFQKFASVMLSIAGPGSNKEPASELIAHAEKIRWSDQKAFEKAAGTGYYLPIIYAPHALGLYISRQLNLTMRSSYALSRGVVLLTSVALMGWALSLYTPNVVTLMLLMTPMTLFQLSSPTIDGLCSAMAMVVIGLWFHLSSTSQQSDNSQISSRELILYGLILILCTARTNLLPLLLIPVLILYVNYTRQRLLAVMGLYIATLGWIAFSVLSTYDNRVVRQYSTVEILTRYITSPLEFLDLLFRTISDQDTRRFYRDSFFGILGWLDTPIPRQAVRVLAVAVGLTVLIMAVITRWRQAVVTRASLLFIGLASTVLIFFAMAVSWTTYPAQTILGIQGRYFLIPCLFMAAALGHVQPGARSLGRIEITAILSFFSYSLYLLVSTLTAQYGMVKMNW